MVGEIQSSNRKRGYRFENKIVNILKRNRDNIVIRSSASLGIADVISCNTNKVRLIQAKTNGYLSPIEREEIYKFLTTSSPMYQFEVWYYLTKKRIKKHIIKAAHEPLSIEKIRARLDKHAHVIGYQKRRKASS